MQVVLYKPARTRLVGTVYRQEERVANAEDSTEDSKELEDQEALSTTLETNSAGSEANQGAEIEKNKTSDTTTAEPNLDQQI
ncbi:hypothetical protein G6F43_000762 [Rhizopus delemar]|nr:hypothetical protein G6F43_000762 [Rhizopus delemar]